jgi:hypothetical protein
MAKKKISLEAGMDVDGILAKAEEKLCSTKNH